MKRANLLALALVLFGGIAAAADLTGKWNGEISGANGSFSLVYDFKQDGTKLTGTVQGPQGDPLKIQDGKIDGDKISFTVTFSGPQGDAKISNEGKIDGDQITLNSKMEGAPEGGFGPITLKRAK
jgi:hypothetical protein